MKDVFRGLSFACKDGLDGYREEYLRHIKDIFLLLADQRLLKSQIKTNEIQKADSLLRFSLIFNELSLLTLSGGKELSMIMLQPQWYQDNFGVEGATFSVSEIKLMELGIDPENPAVAPSFLFPRGSETNNLVAELVPFIEKGRLLIQPDRALFVPKDDPQENGSRRWEAVNVSPFSPLEHWEIAEEVTSRPILMDYQTTDHLDHKSLFEITIPYLEGVSFDDLAKILEDEGDLISGLRSSIKDALKSCGSEVNPNEVVRDVVNPKVDAVNRKFRSIVGSHSFKIAGAAVGTVVLAYTSVTGSGLSSAIATICGSGGIGLLGKEYSSFKEKINSLKEDPYYFLWRCKKLKKQT